MNIEQLCKSDNMSIHKVNELIQVGNNDEIVKGICKIHDDSVVINYVFIKYIANCNTYEFILSIISKHITLLLEKYDLFTVHFNVQHLTLSDIDKHKQFIYNASRYFKTQYPNKLSKCYIYNSPSIFKQIFSVIKCAIDKETIGKITLIHKDVKP